MMVVRLGNCLVSLPEPLPMSWTESASPTNIMVSDSSQHTFSCPHCRQLLRYSPKRAGRKFRCPCCCRLDFVPVQAEAETLVVPSSERVLPPVLARTDEEFRRARIFRGPGLLARAAQSVASDRAAGPRGGYDGRPASRVTGAAGPPRAAVEGEFIAESSPDKAAEERASGRRRSGVRADLKEEASKPNGDSEGKQEGPGTTPEGEDCVPGSDLEGGYSGAEANGHHGPETAPVPPAPKTAPAEEADSESHPAVDAESLFELLAQLGFEVTAVATGEGEDSYSSQG